MITFILSAIATFLLFKFALEYAKKHDADYDNPDVDQFGDSDDDDDDFVVPLEAL